jgi:hypothetical protein
MTGLSGQVVTQGHKVCIAGGVGGEAGRRRYIGTVTSGAALPFGGAAFSLTS